MTDINSNVSSVCHDRSSFWIETLTLEHLLLLFLIVEDYRRSLLKRMRIGLHNRAQTVRFGKDCCSGGEGYKRPESDSERQLLQ